MKMPTSYKIALLFNANKAYDRDVIAGVASFLGSTRASWDIYLEEDFRCRTRGIADWDGDGVIADFDDPAVRAALEGSKMQVVGVGSSYTDAARYPVATPYVATDNGKIVNLAYGRLVETGLQQFALFSVPESPGNAWAQEREHAFAALMERDGLQANIYRGRVTSVESWGETCEQLVEWLRALPKPIGIMAVTDARARQLMQACVMAGIPVPEEVAIVGVDNDPLARMLTRIALTSVIQGAQEMGHTAASLLHRMLHGARLAGTRIVVPPAGINIMASCQHKPVAHPHVMRARHFIRQYACQGIKTEQVADYVGVSRSSLEKHFRRALGSSVHGEILRFKLDAATSRLEEQACNIADVAKSCGFTSVQYMHAVFKREFGCTPRKYQDRVFADSARAAA